MKLICNFIGLIMLGCAFAYMAPAISISLGFLQPMLSEFPVLPLVALFLLAFLILIDLRVANQADKNIYYVWHVETGITGPLSFAEAKKHSPETLITTEDENYWWPCDSWTANGKQPTPWRTRLGLAGSFLLLAAVYAWFQLGQITGFLCGAVGAFLCFVLACFLPGNNGVPQKPAPHLVSALFGDGPRPPDFDAL